MSCITFKVLFADKSFQTQTHEKRMMPEFSTAAKQDICDNCDFCHSGRNSSILMHWNVASFTFWISARQMIFVLCKQ